jgi:hypothetical protein
VDQCCPETDFMYPMKADIYYPVITQTDYGQATKKWVLDRVIILNATPVGGAGQEDIKPEIFLQYDNKLVSRVKEDPRMSTSNGSNAITNILVANIRNAQEELIYKETAGVRAGRGTIYELGTVEPMTGPFGSIDYYKMLLRRAENQTVGD